MSDIDRAVSTLREGREPRREIFGGWLYPAAAVENRPELTTAEVSDMPGYRYVLIDRGDTSDTGDVVRARGNIRPIPGWAVRVGTTRNRPWEYTILEVDIDMMGGEIDGEPQLEPHHLTHEFGHPSGGDDMVRPRFVQLYDFGGWPSTGTTVNIGDGTYNSDGTKRFLPYSNLPLTPWWPSAGNERWVVVCLSTSGTFEVYAGNEDSFVGVDDIPAVDVVGLWELFAAKLKGDETQVIMTPTDPGIIDLRLSRIGWPSASSGFSGFFDDGQFFRANVMNGLITDVQNSISGGWGVV